MEREKTQGGVRKGCRAVMSGLLSGLLVCVCACAMAGVGVREFGGSVVNPCVMLALALLCRGHPLSFVAGLFEVE